MVDGGFISRANTCHLDSGGDLSWEIINTFIAQQLNSSKTGESTIYLMSNKELDMWKRWESWYLAHRAKEDSKE